MYEQQTNQIDTWAIVEIMGHQKLAGYVRTATLGSACMLRVDVPEMPEDMEDIKSFDYQKGCYVTSQVKVDAVPAFTRFLGIAAIFSLTPCTEEFARAAQKRMRATPPAVVDMPKALPAPVGPTNTGEDAPDDEVIYDAE